MPQVLKTKELKQAPAVKTSPKTIALGYIVLALLPIGLKLSGHTPVAAWPWNKVTFTIWAPWVLTGVMSALGWVVYQVQTRRA
jgi:hypothetical protein